jgi:hypothetical protein
MMHLCLKQPVAWLCLIGMLEKKTSFKSSDSSLAKKHVLEIIEHRLLWSKHIFSSPLYHQSFFLVNNTSFLPIFASSLVFFLPNKGTKIVRWYTISICLLEFLLMTYAFCYHF